MNRNSVNGYFQLLRRNGVMRSAIKAASMFRREGWQGLARQIRLAANPQMLVPTSAGEVLDDAEQVNMGGINLVGHPFAALGMGEHVRKSVHAFAAANIPFVLVNTFGQIGAYGDKFPEFPFVSHLTRENPYPVSLFHLNADEMLHASEHLGAAFFDGRYNIGFWSWELSKFPDAWLPSFRYFDEIWAPSRFIQQAVADKASCPVIHMPLAVEAGATTELPRQHFDLPSDKFLFLFMFDFTSYVARKNPLGSYVAFRSAFKSIQSNDVALVIKVNGTQQRPEEYRQFLSAIERDSSIIIIDRVMSDQEVRNLVRNCDCFVSLHRSEGFGRGIAEAMYYGRPVIATGYSGNTDFTHEDNACIVDYALVPVRNGEYPYPDGQLWADPDTEQAGWFMRKLVNERDFGVRLGARAGEYIRTHHSFRAVGERYRRRLTKLGFLGARS